MSDSKLATIRRLLALAADDSGTSAEERELAAQRAAELMAKYAVTEAMLDAARDRTDDPVTSIRIRLDSPYPKPKRILLAVIVGALSCQGVESGGYVHVFGHRSDLDRVEFLYTSLLTQAMSLVLRQSVPGSASRVRSFRGNWLLGFAIRISERMDEGRAEAVADAAAEGLVSEGAEVVLADRRARAEAALSAEFPNTQKGSRAQVTNASGFNAGKAAGDRADLGHARVGGRRRAISA